MLLLLVNALLAIIGSFLVLPALFTGLGIQGKLAYSALIFFVIQFLIVAPFRMWRDAKWVANTENILMELWKAHHFGVEELLNAEPAPKLETYLMKDGPEKEADVRREKDAWIEDWVQKIEIWKEAVSRLLSALNPLDAEEFRNVRIVEYKLEGQTGRHTKHVNMLNQRLEKLQEIISRYR